MRFGRRIWWAALGLRWRIRGAHAAPQRSLALDVRGCAQDEMGRRVAPAFRAKRVCGIRLRDARATRRAGPAATIMRTPVTGPRPEGRAIGRLESPIPAEHPRCPRADGGYRVPGGKRG